MCLIVVAHRAHPDYALVLAANRDEYYRRPTAAAAFWSDAPQVLAGRDLQGGGTWLGVTSQGRWAALTNVRGSRSVSAAPSRGLLVSGYLRGDEAPRNYLERIAAQAHRYAGFNLLAGDSRTLACFSNDDGGLQVLAPGCYGLSNHHLDTPWPKLERAKNRVKKLLARPDFDPGQLWKVLADRHLPPAEALPETGLPGYMERALGAIFVHLPDYGTRCSTVLAITYDGHVSLIERRFGKNGHIEGESPFRFMVHN
ncbi:MULTISPECIES: NRDE family protein [Syntrophotalea]|jgi:uncharacterized protein with NRDE domain|uniref:NRDE family protein n=1 Tax=Syntrophotalea acetylenica TaxID=29542 RepID=A0A1L3GGA5_SYNAC|nr:NRDE family protein [Syntrophotalea acetylenica]APG24708.1 hypothetical protein A7E75_06465 [Syntrophotalea acetylenica]APG42764.1 hypothetical protein A6070_00400 [Syntrophotalea acetylenica]MDY0261743.1 NRDE family protein [Syntrophotalea acetylenica]